MKHKIVVVLVLTAYVNCTEDGRRGQSVPRDSNFPEEAEYLKQLNVLDSVVKNTPNDTSYYCCSYSIDLLERVSGIDGSADGTTLGKLSFTKSDYLKWKSWYVKKKKGG